jgi:TonB family protein
VDGGKFKEAEPLLRRALEIREKAHGAQSPKLVPPLLNLADLNFLRGQAGPAHTALGRALSILALQPPAKDAATARRLRNYQCLLWSATAARNEELAKQVSTAAWRLEEPEKAAKFEKRRKEREEREARGEVDQKPDEGGVLNGKAVSKPVPGYPAEAKQQGIAGTVIIRILVDEAGRVVNAEAVCGHPLLAKEAVEAARRARFTPTLLSGMPVKVSGIITYNFVLQ